MLRIGISFCLLSLLLVACDSSEEAEETKDVTQAPSNGGGEPGWHVEQESLPGALLSVWGASSSDVFAVGADPDDGKGPMVMHFDGSSWTRVETGASAGLWWVFGPEPDKEIWMVGDEGLILRMDRASNDVTQIPSPTDATLYGIWGPPGGPLYAVGGFVLGEDGPGVIVRIEGDTATLVDDLPDDVDPKAAFFKVWGTGAGDVWVIGEEGTMLRYNGTSWSHKALPGAPRLVTLHGAGTGDMVVVGGVGQATIMERLSDGDWSDVSPEETAALNGVFVTGSGVAYSAGMMGVVLMREEGAWHELPAPPLPMDWHAVWVDGNGDLWVAGGNLVSVDTMNAGTLLRYGPER